MPRQEVQVRDVGAGTSQVLIPGRGSAAPPDQCGPTPS